MADLTRFGELMAEWGVSDRDLSRATGLSPESIARYRKGQTTPSIKDAHRVVSGLRDLKIKVEITTAFPDDDTADRTSGAVG